MIFTLLQGSRTKPAISPRYVCIYYAPYRIMVRIKSNTKVITYQVYVIHFTYTKYLVIVPWLNKIHLSAREAVKTAVFLKMKRGL